MSKEEIEYIKRIIEKAVKEKDLDSLKILSNHLRVIIGREELDNPSIKEKEDLLILPLTNYLGACPIQTVQNRRNHIYRAVKMHFIEDSRPIKTLYVFDLLRLSEVTLKRSPFIGPVTIKELNIALQSDSLNLGMNISDHDKRYLIDKATYHKMM